MQCSLVAHHTVHPRTWNTGNVQKFWNVTDYATAEKKLFIGDPNSRTAIISSSDVSASILDLMCTSYGRGHRCKSSWQANNCLILVQHGYSAQTFTHSEIKRLRSVLHRNPCKSYGASLALCHNTVLPSTPHPSQGGWYAIYLSSKDTRLSGPQEMVICELMKMISTHPYPGTNQAWHTTTTLTGHNVLTTKPCHHLEAVAMVNFIYSGFYNMSSLGKTGQDKLEGTTIFCWLWVITF